jgi:AraC-like DNA-binding protein
MGGFEMVFKPCAAYRLFGVEMAHLMNEGLDAESMLGKSISELWHRMGEATTFQQRIQIVENFLIPYAQASRPAIAGLTSHIAKLHGSVRVSDLASAAGISRRQLERQFRAQVGLTPKCFARIYRYESALLLKATIPKRSWSAIAHELGYSDHMQYGA